MIPSVEAVEDLQPAENATTATKDGATTTVEVSKTWTYNSKLPFAAENVADKVPKTCNLQKGAFAVAEAPRHRSQSERRP